MVELKASTCFIIRYMFFLGGGMRDNKLSDFEKIKYIASKEYQSGNYENALKCITLAAELAYRFNFIYADDELESLCVKIGAEFKLSQKELTYTDIVKFNNAIIFYDCFAYDSRGLTQQYIRALLKCKVPLVFILNSGKSLCNSKDIFLELDGNPLVRVIEIEKNISLINKIEVICSIVNQISPSKAFLHMAPNDAVGVSAWSQFESVTKFQINLTDHAFWLGVSCLDYCLEFRPYGRQLSKYQRHISEKKLIYMPYYPIIKSDSNFDGFPFKDFTGNIKIFSGGSLYKFYGDGGLYFRVMKRVLDRYPNTILIIAGDGQRSPFNEFISSNNFSDRVYLLGNRQDLNAIFNHVDIYVGSYPISGGLMSQIAASSGVPVVQYSREDLPFNIVEALLPNISPDNKITFFNESDFFNEVSRLIENSEYRQNRSLSIRNTLISIKDFDERVRVLLDNPSCTGFSNEPIEYKINTVKIQEIYNESEIEQCLDYRISLISIYNILIKNDMAFFIKIALHLITSKLVIKKIMKRILHAI